MDKEKMVKVVESLIVKANEAKDSNDALKLSQAACNAANALRVIIEQ